MWWTNTLKCKHNTSCSTLKHKNQQHQKVFLLGLGFRLFFVCLVCVVALQANQSLVRGAARLKLSIVFTRDVSWLWAGNKFTKRRTDSTSALVLGSWWADAKKRHKRYLKTREWRVLLHWSTNNRLLWYVSVCFSPSLYRPGPPNIPVVSSSSSSFLVLDFEKKKNIKSGYIYTRTL